MNGDLRRTSVVEMMSLYPSVNDIILHWSTVSDPLMVGQYGDQVVCFVGLIPPTILSDEAYVWLYTTDAVDQHRIAFARWSRRFIAAALERYPIIFGHCPRSSWKWLRSLGAQIEEAHEDYFKYSIRAIHE